MKVTITIDLDHEIDRRTSAYYPIGYVLKIRAEGFADLMRIHNGVSPSSTDAIAIDAGLLNAREIAKVFKALGYDTITIKVADRIQGRANATVSSLQGDLDALQGKKARAVAFAAKCALVGDGEEKKGAGVEQESP